MKKKLIHVEIESCMRCPFKGYLNKTDEYKCIKTGKIFDNVNDVIYQTKFPKWCPFDDMEE